MGVNGYLMQIQPFSVNDGEGIRTNLFLAGCPMHCRWCANPEGYRQEPVIGFYAGSCIGCGSCARVCPQGIGIDLNAQRERCVVCGACVRSCPKEARRQMVRYTDADSMIAEVERYTLFYRASRGGVTFTGGEATSQPALLNYLSARLYDLGYSLDLETCGYFDFDLLYPSLSRMDLIFMDLKHMDNAVHRQYTGVGNEKTLQNIRLLNRLDADVVIRIPVIGGVNDDEENIRRSASFVKEALPKARMELLPYHTLGFAKYEALGMEKPDAAFYTPSKEAMEDLREIVRNEGVDLADFAG